MKKTIGEKIKEIRIQNNLTMDELAQELVYSSICSWFFIQIDFILIISIIKINKHIKGENIWIKK